MKNINQKTIQTKLKDGYGTQQFLDELGITEEQFFFELRRIYTDNSINDIKKRLARNDKKFAKKVKSIKHEGYSYESKSLLLPNSLLVKKIALNKIVHNIELKKDEIEQLEKNLNEENNTFSSLQESIAQIDKTIYELQSRLEHFKQKKEEILTNINNKKISISVISSKLATCQEQLDNLLQQKANLENVSIFVYEDGSIEANDVILTEEDIPEVWISIHQSLFGREVLDCLTGLECKTLAKLLAYVKSLPNCEICFESDTLQACFELLRD